MYERRQEERIKSTIEKVAHEIVLKGGHASSLPHREKIAVSGNTNGRTEELWSARNGTI